VTDGSPAIAYLRRETTPFGDTTVTDVDLTDFNGDGLVDYFGADSTPELTIGRLVRIAIALPAFIEAVEVDGHLYVDGGIIDLFPAEPILRDGGFDHVFLKDKANPPAYLSACATPGTWTCTTVQYKSGTRAHIEKDLGYEIIANFGDQYSDLDGGYADRTYKLPNPTYFVG